MTYYDGVRGPLNQNRGRMTRLVRSQAIRESQSPPRLSTSASSAAPKIDYTNYTKPDKYYDNSRQMVEIQISAAWDEQNDSDATCQTVMSIPDDKKMCVCGQCASRFCEQCRYKRKQCPAKQDSGIVCSDDCVECTSTSSESTYASEGCQCHKQKRPEIKKNDSLDQNILMTTDELITFLKDTLNRTAKDRATLMSIEKELLRLILDERRVAIRFPTTSSYKRMLIHRVAELFCLKHKPELQSTVLVTKQGAEIGKIPCERFKDWCTSTYTLNPTNVTATEEQPAKYILKRSSNSLESRSLDSAGNPLTLAQRSKSLEQREIEYIKTRTRIFTEESKGEEVGEEWAEGTSKLLSPEDNKNKLLKVKSLEVDQQTPSGGENKSQLAKSHSFGDQPPRILSRQGDLASSSWRLSPSSSGYKTLSFRSTPSPTSAVTLPEQHNLLWCISDASSIPAGAIIIHPQTGQPLTNPDGSPYYFDPTKPVLSNVQTSTPVPAQSNDEHMVSHHITVTNGTTYYYDTTKMTPPSPIVTTVSTEDDNETSENPQEPRRQRGRLQKQMSMSRDDPNCDDATTPPYASDNVACQQASRLDWRHSCSQCNGLDVQNKQLKNKTDLCETNYNPKHGNDAICQPTNDVESPYLSTNDNAALYQTANENAPPYSAANDSYSQYHFTNENFISTNGSSLEYDSGNKVEPILSNVETPEVAYEPYYGESLYETKPPNGHIYYQNQLQQNVETPNYLEHVPIPSENIEPQPIYIDQKQQVYSLPAALMLESQPYCYEQYLQNPIYDPSYAATIESQNMQLLQARSYALRQLSQQQQQQYQQPTVLLQPAPAPTPLIHTCPMPTPTPQWPTTWPPAMLPTQKTPYPVHQTDAYPGVYPVVPLYNYYPMVQPVIQNNSSNYKYTKYESKPKYMENQKFKVLNRNESFRSDKSETKTSSVSDKTSDGVSEPQHTYPRHNYPPPHDYATQMQHVKDHFTKMGIADGTRCGSSASLTNFTHRFRGNPRFQYGGYRNHGDRRPRPIEHKSYQGPPMGYQNFENAVPYRNSHSYNSYRNKDDYAGNEDRTQNAIAQIQNTLHVRTNQIRNGQIPSSSWYRRGGGEGRGGGPNSNSYNNSHQQTERHWRS